MKFNPKSFLNFIILFLLEVLIVLFFKTGFIRYIFGDFLVVIMLYYFLKSFINAKPISISIWVLIFAFVIEFLQMTNLLAFLNLEQNKLAHLILGTTFEFTDLLAYSLGIVCVLFIEKKR